MTTLSDDGRKPPEYHAAVSFLENRLRIIKRRQIIFTTIIIFCMICSSLTTLYLILSM